jgi:hypothetical protein
VTIYFGESIRYGAPHYESFLKPHIVPSLMNANNLLSTLFSPLSPQCQGSLSNSDHSFIHQWLYNSSLGPGLFFSFVIFSYTFGRTLWKSDQPVSRPLPAHRTTQTQYKSTQKHRCLEWDSNPRSQRSSERRQLMA